MNEWLDRVQHALLPTHCLLCAGDLAPATSPPTSPVTHLCAPCAAELPRLGPACRRCAAPLPQPALCPRCLRQAPPYACAWAPFSYVAPVSTLVRDLKFRARLTAADTLGALLAAHLKEAGALAERPDAVVAVPLHPGRLRRRGFNQALEIGRRVSRELDLPLLARAARRVRATAPQSALASRGERRRNVRGAFVASFSPGALGHVAILDDVLTTGATVSELARALRRAGVGRVDVWAAARAGSPGPAAAGG